MQDDRAIAVWIGIMFIGATGFSLGAAAFIGPALGTADLAAGLAAAPVAVTGAVVMMLAAIGCALAIPALFWPVLSRQSRVGAALYLALRLVENVGYFLMATLTLGALKAALAGDAGLVRVLKGTSDAAMNAGAPFFSLSAIVLGVMLWQSRLVPRWISGWSVLGGALLCISGISLLFGPLATPVETALTAPIALGEMVLAIWLIARGFDAAALARSGE